MVVNVEKEQETRKGPWTEQEDLQLVCFVSLFGERRWDFIAKVSGLNRTGKSCRLRWVNYLHPGLKRGRMTPQEERLVLELHSKWGNRWSRIARRLPGRTDNEIKNYWRTHMRKMAQEGKRNSFPSSSPNSASCSSLGQPQVCLASEKRLQDGIAAGISRMPELLGETDGGVKAYPMDQIWNEIDTSESICASSFQEPKSEGWNISCPPMASPMWDSSSGPLWKNDNHEEFNTFTPMTDLLVCNYHHDKDYS